MSTSELKEIKSIDEIKLMVDTFYDRINKDDLLSPIFNDIAGVNWELHLPQNVWFLELHPFWNSRIQWTAFPSSLKITY